ncbi:MAG: hypothetical protein ABF296_02995 [Oceanococcaceae bacterium]
MADNKRGVTELLDETIGAIASHRHATNLSRAEQIQQIDRAWDELCRAARELRPRVANNDKVRYFTVARDGLSIAVSFRGSHREAKGQLLEMSRHHPDGMYRETEAIWVRETGRADQRLVESKDAVKFLVNFCAHNLADSAG